MVSTARRKARRAVLVLALGAAMTVALPGMASADPPPQANASCFGTSESALTKEFGPGFGISESAKALAGPDTPESSVGEVASNLVKPLQEATHAACQENPTPP